MYVSLCFDLPKHVESCYDVAQSVLSSRALVRTGLSLLFRHTHLEKKKLTSIIGWYVGQVILNRERQVGRFLIVQQVIDDIPLQLHAHLLRMSVQWERRGVIRSSGFHRPDRRTRIV